MAEPLCVLLLLLLLAVAAACWHINKAPCTAPSLIVATSMISAGLAAAS
jgi:hypothetical protein